ncbi:origin recognition complex subunit 3 N-terminus-domain-containing protein [Halenospora varia]|nr:origin recognition complex subunit 3 N-terminus-domain-containing protein [Halenospora varia]
MSDIEDTNSHAGFDSIDHQPTYIYVPSNELSDSPERPAKRRKSGKSKAINLQPNKASSSVFESLLGGLESTECVKLRHELFQQAWGKTDARIQSLLNEANEGAFAEVTSFVNGTTGAENDKRVPACFIVTGPNIASQDTLFQQLSGRLKEEIDGSVVTLRSGDATNLKAVLKQVIRDATNQKFEEDELSDHIQDNRKLLNYDLEILHNFVKKHESQKVVVAIQDSEAFETSLIMDLISLFSSWLDRIPFVILFGVATSVELFQERLPKIASRYLQGIQIYVEQTSTVIEKVFEKAVANPLASLCLGPAIISTLMERQQDHVQSVQSFVAALKYAYMCHYYGNALSVFNTPLGSLSTSIKMMLPCHYEAVRTLPSFRKLAERFVATKQLDLARDARALFEDDKILIREMEHALKSRHADVVHLLRALHVLRSSSTAPEGIIDSYITIFEGGLQKSDALKGVLNAVKRSTPTDLIALIQRINTAIQEGNADMELDGWAKEEHEFLTQVRDIEKTATIMLEEAEDNGVRIRSSYDIHNKSARATVVAQRVQLSYEESTLTEEEKRYTKVIDRFIRILEEYFDLEDPQDRFMNEAWLCNTTISLLDAFAPRPRASIEEALSAPDQYLPRLSTAQSPAVQHATAVMYQRYLEAGSLINMADMWSSFLEQLMEAESEECDEREALMLFYRGLADLKLLGMVKQSKKKADHLAKISWQGL